MASILQQTDVDLEIILLQEGQAPSLHELTQLDWPETVPLYLLTADYPCGKSHLVKLGLEHVHGDYLLVLDSGDELAEDALGTMVEELDQSEPGTIGVYGTVELYHSHEWGESLETLHGDLSNHRFRLLSLLEHQKGIAPPLVRTETMRRLGGYPTNYPSQGWLLADTAYVLALLVEGRLDYLPEISMRRAATPTDPFLAEDEQRILQLLLRQAAKRISAPPDFLPITYKQKPLG
ncbi:MAG: glycosyltransferase [Tumebacillaceae bacterium]